MTSASELVWGLVCGLPEPIRSRRLLMPLKAFIDESGLGQPPVLVLAGYISSADRWARFSDEWSRLLNTWPKPSHVNMDDAMRLDGEFRYWSEKRRDEWLTQCRRIVVEHAMAAVACCLPYGAFSQTFLADDRVPREFQSRYFYAFFGLLHQMSRKQNLLKIDQKVDFVFDNQCMEKASIFEAWDDFANSEFVNRELLGNTPVFADDKDILPLQAADMCAWMVRSQWLDQAARRERRRLPWDGRGLPDIPIQYCWWTEEDLRAHVERGLRRSGEL